MLRLDQDCARCDNRRDGLQSRCAHSLPRLDKIDNAVCDTERACCLNTATDVLDVRLQLSVLRVAVGRAALLSLQLPEVLLRQVCERGDDVLADEVLRLSQIALLRYLDLQTAFSEVEVEDLNDTGCGCGRDAALVLLDLVAASDSKVDTTLTNEGRDIGGGEEDEREGKVLDERDIEA